MPSINYTKNKNKIPFLFFFSSYKRLSVHRYFENYCSQNHIELLNQFASSNGSTLCLSLAFCLQQHKHTVIRQKKKKFQAICIFGCWLPVYKYTQSISLCCLLVILVVFILSVLSVADAMHTDRILKSLYCCCCNFVQCISQFYHTIIHQCTLHLHSSRLLLTPPVLIESCPKFFKLYGCLNGFWLKLPKSNCLIAWSHESVYFLRLNTIDPVCWTIFISDGNSLEFWC